MKRESALMLAALSIAAATAFGTASADGRPLTGEFCTNANAMPKPGACIQLSYDGQTAQGYTNSSNRTLNLRPGTYWLSVNDTSSAHDFSLEDPNGSDQNLTAVAATPGWVTTKINLTPGTWVLFCDPHRAMGMYININVGGVGQVD
jgi:plastocyanin